MNFTLRPFQQHIINQVAESARTHQNIVIIASCGAGKTVIASALIDNFITKNKNRKILFLVDNRTLIEQTASKLTQSYGVIADKYQEPLYEQHSVFIAMVQTLRTRERWLNLHWDLILIDECHLTTWYSVTMELVRRSTKWVIGLTATPYRLSSKQCFADVFQDTVVSPSFAELQDMGFLAKLEYYGLEHEDFSQVKIAQGDYATGAISKIVNTERTILKALDKYKELAHGKRAIAFSVDVNHAKHICAIANREGIPAALITGETKQRDLIFDSCRRGEILLLVSCMCLTKGFDLPEIEVGLLMRPSKSLAIIEQQVGRVARIANDKHKGIIIDCVGNLEVSGYPCDRVHTKESVLSRKPLKEAGDAPVKTCPECSRIIRAQLMVCPYCTYNFPPKKKELVEFTGNFDRLITAREVKADGSEAIHREYFRQLIRKHYKNTGCTSGAITEYKQKGFEAYPSHNASWGLGAIFGGDQSKRAIFIATVKRGVQLRFRGNPPSWIVPSMIKLEWGS